MNNYELHEQAQEMTDKYSAYQLARFLLKEKEHSNDMREVLQLALSSYGKMLMSDPPQDAWKYNKVEEKARAILNSTDKEDMV